MSNTRIAEAVRQAGVVGAGGGGFPTHVKLQAKAEIVIVNAAECEPLLHKDKEILQAYPDKVFRGLELAMQAVSAQRGVLGIKRKHAKLIGMLREKLPAHTNVTLAELSDSYPAGDEFILVYDTTGKVIPPGGLPLHVGAMVINVETAMNIADAVEKPVTEKFLTVGGAVAEPATYKVPIGISYKEVVDAAGGVTADDPAILVGGAMMGTLSLDFSEPVTKTCTGLVVLPKDHMLIQKRMWSEKQVRQIGRSACDQCSFCTEFCPRYLLGHPIEPHKAMRSLGFSLVGESLVVGTLFCCECNLCSLYACPEDLDPRNVCVLSKQQLRREGKDWPQAPTEPHRVVNVMPFRRVPIKKLSRRIGLWSYRDIGPLRSGAGAEFHPKKVVLPLKQHAGAPAEPIVKPAQKIRCGEMIARIPEGKLGANLHASIDGVIESVDQTKIVIASS